VLGIWGICRVRLFWGTKCSRISCNLSDWLASIYHTYVVGKGSLIIMQTTFCAEKCYLLPIANIWYLFVGSRFVLKEVYSSIEAVHPLLIPIANVPS
jgi:hypothetical protein